jgi:hypothetical protein
LLGKVKSVANFLVLRNLLIGRLRARPIVRSVRLVPKSVFVPLLEVVAVRIVPVKLRVALNDGEPGSCFATLMSSQLILSAIVIYLYVAAPFARGLRVVYLGCQSWIVGAVVTWHRNQAEWC